MEPGGAPGVKTNFYDLAISVDCLGKRFAISVVESLHLKRSSHSAIEAQRRDLALD